MIIVGSSSLQKSDGAAVLANAIVLADALRSSMSEGKDSESEWKVLNVLHRHAGQVGAIDVGYRPGPSAIKQVCYRHFRHDSPTDTHLLYTMIYS